MEAAVVAILATAMVAAAEVGAGSEREAARAARSAAAPVALVATVAVSAAENVEMADADEEYLRRAHVLA